MSTVLYVAFHWEMNKWASSYYNKYNANYSNISPSQKQVMKLQVKCLWITTWFPCCS